MIAKPEIVFESGKVKVTAPIATKANLGPYFIEVDNVTPMHMSGSLKPPPISGTLEMGRCKYKYNAEIEYKLDVIWHQRPKGKPGEPVKVTAPTSELNQNVADYPTKSTKWDQVVDEKGVVVAVVFVLATAAVSVLYRIATRGGLQPAQIMPPFTHTIDRHDPRA